MTDIILLGSEITVGGDCSHEIKRCLLLGRKAITDLDSILKNKDITLPTKLRVVKAMVFPVVIYECESWTKKGWALKNWCLWTVVLEKTLESPLDCKEVKPLNPKGNQPWVFIGRTDADVPILQPRDVKSRIIGKYPDTEKDLGQEEKGLTEDELVKWHHWLNGDVWPNFRR